MIAVTQVYLRYSSMILVNPNTRNEVIESMILSHKNELPPQKINPENRVPCPGEWQLFGSKLGCGYRYLHITYLKHCRSEAL